MSSEQDKQVVPTQGNLTRVRSEGDINGVIANSVFKSITCDTLIMGSQINGPVGQSNTIQGSDFPITLALEGLFKRIKTLESSQRTIHVVLGGASTSKIVADIDHQEELQNVADARVSRSIESDGPDDTPVEAEVTSQEKDFEERLGRFVKRHTLEDTSFQSIQENLKDLGETVNAVVQEVKVRRTEDNPAFVRLTKITSSLELRMKRLEMVLKVISAQLPRIDDGFKSNNPDSSQDASDSDSEIQNIEEKVQEILTESPDDEEAGREETAKLQSDVRGPNDVLFVLGGEAHGISESLVETFDFQHERWIRQSDITDGPDYENLCVSIGTKIFVIERLRRRFRSFDAVTKQWINLRPLPKRTEGMCIAECKGILYLMGGYRSDRCFAYDPESDSWAKRGMLSRERVYAGAAALKGRMYCSGGRVGNKSIYLSSVESLTLDDPDDLWSAVQSMHQARRRHCLVSCGTFLWAVGGFAVESTMSELERFEPITDTWTTMSPMPTPRQGLTVSILGNFLYAIGGSTAKLGHETVDVTEVYNLDKDEWSASASICKPRYRLSSCVIRDLDNAVQYNTTDPSPTSS